MKAPSSVCFLAFLSVACGKTQIQFENDIPGASIENVRWDTGHGSSYDQVSDQRLEPGQRSESISVADKDQSKKGRIHVELVVDGRKVALVTEPEFKPNSQSLKTFRLTAETRATNPLVDAEASK